MVGTIGVKVRKTLINVCQVEDEDKIIGEDPKEVEEVVEEFKEIQEVEEDKEFEEEDGNNNNGENLDNIDDLNDEPIQSFLVSFSKETLITLFSEVAEKHLDVANRVRKLADVDPAQCKIFVHGFS
ncbi:unnamed protein product [Fraxinus pennsylvanica]|uniref:Uncharacterized protein n=1 Tax=Fraxinus pennsylvanica TaxID=56036 RepID=A0AAD1Z2R3_9LAMI|nr:unnamed protein product [Fraxinus pennsylvanica]